MQENHYKRLQIQPYAHQAVIAVAYRILTKYYADTQLLEESYNILKNSGYDDELYFSQQTWWSDGDTGYYELLQLQPYAVPELITAVYRLLSKQYHPDTAKEQADVARFRLLKKAYQVLSDPATRREYDLSQGLMYGYKATQESSTTAIEKVYDYEPVPDHKIRLFATRVFVLILCAILIFGVVARAFGY